MADLKTNPVSNISTTLTTCNVTPAAGKKHVVGSWIIANTGAEPASITAVLTRSAVNYNLIKAGKTIGVGNSLFLVGLLGKLVLEPGDLLKLQTATATQFVDSILSISEEP